MKKSITTFLLLLFVFSLFSQQSFRVTYDGNFGDKNVTPQFVGKKSKSQRVSSSVGTTQIKAECSQDIKNLDPLAPFIIEEAVKMWREQLLFVHKTANIILNFDVMDLGTLAAYRSVTTYHTDENGIKYPMALYQALYGSIQGDSEETTIFINSNKSYWYFDGDEDTQIQPGQYDFKTAVLRALAQVFGFKSSINQTRPLIIENNFVNCFDSKIINSNNILYSSLDINDRTQQQNYFQGNNVYFDKPNLGLKLYAPATYARGLTMDYFDSQNELMSYNFTPGSQIWKIDDRAMKVLHTIGWLVKETGFKINGSMGNTGIGAIFNSYSFNASAVTGSISNHYWEYRIKKKDSTHELIKTANTANFSISPLSTVKAEYETSSDGDILGEIYLRGNVNGFTYETTFNLYLECKPGAITHDFKIIGIDEWYYKIEVTMQSTGATEFGMTVTDWEENITLSTNYPDRNNYVKAKTFTLTYDSPIIFSLRSKNAHGITTKNVTLPAVSYRRINNIDIVGKIKYDLVNFNGDIIKHNETKSEIFNGTINKGLYILREIDEAGTLINTEKLLITK